MLTLYIIVEGIDCSGKSSVCDALESWFKEEMIQYKRLKEPSLGACKDILEMIKGLQKSSPEYFEMTKDYLFSMCFTIDRLLLRPTVDELNDKGVVVLSDRSFLSTMAYQAGVGDEFLDHLTLYVAEPDAFIFLDVSPETSINRLEQRKGSPDYFESLENLSVTRRNYFNAIEMVPTYTHIVNAEQPLNVVVEKCKEIIQAYIEVNKKLEE